MNTSTLVAVVIPSHDKEQNPLDQLQFRTWSLKTHEFFAAEFGGATEFRAEKGSYLSKDLGKIIWDEPHVIESFASVPENEFIEALERLGKFAREMRNSLKQEEVMYTVGNSVIFV